MLSVSLKSIRIHAQHGLYAGEAEWGNTFEVDITLKAETMINVDWPYFDYSEIHRIVIESFKVVRPLLEELVKEIYGQLRNHFTAASSIAVKLRKMNPPMGGSVAWAEVGWEG